MQALARQFNLSETTFILPSSDRRRAHVRIFTPAFEMPFAGHPTLGTAHVVRALRGGDSVTLEMKAGIVPVDGATATLDAARREAAGDAAGRRDARRARADARARPTTRSCDEPLWVNTGIRAARDPDRERRARARGATPVPS